MTCEYPTCTPPNVTLPPTNGAANTHASTTQPQPMPVTGAQHAGFMDGIGLAAVLLGSVLLLWKRTRKTLKAS